VNSTYTKDCDHDRGEELAKDDELGKSVAQPSDNNARDDGRDDNNGPGDNDGPDDGLNGTDPYDLSKLRIDSAVKVEHEPRQIAKITNRKPKADEIFTVHDRIEPVEIYTILDEHDKTGGLNGSEYLVSEIVVARYDYHRKFRKQLAFPAVNRFGQLFLWVIPCPAKSGRRSSSAESQEQWAWVARKLSAGKPVWQLIDWDDVNFQYTRTVKKLNQQPAWPDGLNSISDWLRLVYPLTTRFLQLPLTEAQEKLLHLLLGLDDE
jgi:hypothetical protein